MKNILLICIVGLLYSNSNDKIITIGGCVTEIVFDLGLGRNVIAVDQSSTSPLKVKELPQVGYIRAISSEGVLSMFPDVILTTTDIGPPNALEQIKKSGIEVHVFKSPHSFDDILSLISQISTLLNVEPEGEKLIKELSLVAKKTKEIKDEYSYSPKIAFFMNPSDGSYSAAGSRTRADYLIEFIGGINVFSDQFQRYKKVSKEAIVAVDPDFILIGSTMNLISNESESIFESSVEFQSLKSVHSKNIFHVDMGKSLTFGPSFAKNAYELINKLDIE